MAHATAQDGAETGAADAGPRMKYSVPALEKGLQILELLSEQDRGLTQTEVAERMGKSLNEIFRMIVCMRDLGYVAFIPDSDRYILTPKLFELSHRHPPMKRLITEAVPRMQALAHALQQSCHLTVYHDGRQVVVAQVDNPGGMGFSVRMGTQLDLLLTASGRALLAFQPPDALDRIIADYKGAATAAQIAEVRALLPLIRSAGHAEMESLQVRGVRALSCPVLDQLGNPVAAMVVPFLEQMGDGKHPAFDEARRRLGHVARDLSRAIGADPDAAPVVPDRAGRSRGVSI